MNKLLSFYLFEALYLYIINLLNKKIRAVSSNTEFTHQMTIISPPCQSILNQSNMGLSLLINISVESLHSYACKSYYELLNQLQTQNLTYEYNKTTNIPISKKLIHTLLSESGVIYTIESTNEIPELSDDSLIEIDQGKLGIKFSFLKSKIKYNIVKLKDSIRGMTVSPLLLKYLNFLALNIKTKESTAYFKRLKKFMQNSQGRNTVLSERFNETLNHILKDVFSRSPFVLY